MGHEGPDQKITNVSEAVQAVLEHYAELKRAKTAEAAEFRVQYEANPPPQTDEDSEYTAREDASNLRDEESTDQFVAFWVDEVDSSIRAQVIAELHQQGEDGEGAARILQGVQRESMQE